MTMAAVRCLARRLGGSGSLLQRTQAEEGRRLAPSSLLPSRGLSGEHAPKSPNGGQLSYKEYLETRATLRETIRKLEEHRKATRPTASNVRVRSIGRSVKTLVGGSAKLAILGLLIASAFDGITSRWKKPRQRKTSEGKIGK